MRSGNVGSGGVTQALIDDTHKVYPACYDLDNIIAVGASDQNDNIVSGTCYGKPYVDLFAPGVNIKTTTMSGSNTSNMTSTYTYESGTSMAAPYVAGVAALLLSRKPSLTTEQLKKAILISVDKMDSLINSCTSGGRLNAKQAFDYARIHVNPVYTKVDNHVHHVKCDYCDKTESHTWQPMGIVGTGVRSYKCMECKAFSKMIPVIFESIAPVIQSELAALTLTGEEYATIVVDEHTAIVYDNGQLYLMVECDEFGKVVADVPDGIFAQGYTLDKIIAEQRV